MIVSHCINLILILISCLVLSLNLVTQMWKIILKYPGTFQYTLCRAHYETRTTGRPAQGCDYWLGSAESPKRGVAFETVRNQSDITLQKLVPTAAALRAAAVGTNFCKQKFIIAHSNTFTADTTTRVIVNIWIATIIGMRYTDDKFGRMILTYTRGIIILP